MQEAAQDVAEKLGIARELISDVSGEGRDPLPMCNPGQYAIGQVCRDIVHSPRAAGRAQAARFAREGHQAVESALLAANVSEAVLEESAFEVAPEGMLDESGISVLAVLRCLPEELETMTLHQLVEHGGLGLAAPIGSRRRRRSRAGTVLIGMDGVERVG